MSIWKRPLFLVSVFLFGGHQLLQWVAKINLPWADNYLDNLLLMPLVLNLWLAERRLLYKKGSAYQLSYAQVSAATLYLLIVTEGVFPLLSNRFTADVMDVVYTIAGAMLYFLSVKNYRDPHSNKSVAVEDYD